jgi:nitrate reductase assembly molybdenum cofactor insertion protein NarJ
MKPLQDDNSPARAPDLRALRAAAPLLGALLEYPSDDHLTLARVAASAFAGCDPSIARALTEHADHWAAQPEPQRALQESYTQTFDLAPRCTLLVSVHLFGPESFERAQMMAGLVGSYAEAGFTQRATELPDHLSELLRAAPLLPEALWVDLAVCCLSNALTRMLRLTDDPRAPNPWRFLLRAVDALVRAEVEASGLTPPPPPSISSAARAERSQQEAPHV